MRPSGRGVLAVALTLGVLVTGAQATRPADEAILPPEDYPIVNALDLKRLLGLEAPAPSPEPTPG